MVYQKNALISVWHLMEMLHSDMCLWHFECSYIFEGDVRHFAFCVWSFGNCVLSFEKRWNSFENVWKFLKTAAQWRQLVSWAQTTLRESLRMVQTNLTKVRQNFRENCRRITLLSFSSSSSASSLLSHKFAGFHGTSPYKWMCHCWLDHGHLCYCSFAHAGQFRTGTCLHLNLIFPT